MVCILAFSSAIYIWIGRACWRAMADAGTPVARVGLLLLVWSMIWLACFLAMFVCDAILILFFRNPGYSGFVYAAWGFAVLFYLFMYLSVGTACVARDPHHEDGVMHVEIVAARSCRFKECKCPFLHSRDEWSNMNSKGCP